MALGRKNVLRMAKTEIDKMVKAAKKPFVNPFTSRKSGWYLEVKEWAPVRLGARPSQEPMYVKTLGPYSSQSEANQARRKIIGDIWLRDEKARSKTHIIVTIPIRHA